jgi:hypothetical protein
LPACLSDDYDRPLDAAHIRNEHIHPQPEGNPLRSRILAAILLGATLASCAVPRDPNMANHEAETDRVAAMRSVGRVPGPPDPRRKIHVQDCTQQVVADQANLFCQ